MNIPKFQTQAIIHFFGTQSTLYGYGLAVLTVVIAAIATHTVPVIGERAAFLLFFFCDYPDCFLAWTESGHSRDDLVLDCREYSCIVSGQYWDLRRFDFKRRLLLIVCLHDRHDQLPSEVNCGVVGKPARLGLCTNRRTNRQLAFECATQ